MYADMVRIEGMIERMRQLLSAQDLIPAPAALAPVLGPRPAQYAAVEPVALVLDKAPAIFTDLRAELLTILEDCAEAFRDAAAILEGAESAAVDQVREVSEQVETAIDLGDTSASPNAPSSAPGSSSSTSGSGATTAAPPAGGGPRNGL